MEFMENLPRVRGHLITNLSISHAILICNSIVDKGFQAYNLFLLIVQLL